GQVRRGGEERADKDGPAGPAWLAQLGQVRRGGEERADKDGPAGPAWLAQLGQVRLGGEERADKDGPAGPAWLAQLCQPVTQCERRIHVRAVVRVVLDTWQGHGPCDGESM